ncbi:unnamed protein product, partial [Closterium sp. NIES-53]
SSLYTLSTESPPVSASVQVAASSQVLAAASGSGPESAPCSCRLLSHQTLLWHHRLGHPSLPRLRGMASRVLVSGLPRSLPPLPPGPAPTCVPCVEGRQRAAPHSSEFPPTEAPLQTLHMDVWGPARVRGKGHERYFLLVVDDYSRYTTVFPLRSKGEVTEVLIDWIRAARLRLRESFGSDFPVLLLHSDRGGEFSSALLGAFCRAQGIRQTFTLPASPQQNGIAERRIGMVMDVAPYCDYNTEPGGAEPGVTEPGGTEPGGAGSARVASRGASSRREVLSPRELREWFARRWSRAAGAGGTPATTGSGGTRPGGAGAAGPGGTAEAAGVGPTGVRLEFLAVLVLPVLLGLQLLELLELERLGVLALVVLLTLVRPRVLELVLLELKVLLALVLLLGVLVLSPLVLACPQPVQSQSLLQPVSPLPAPSPYTGPTGGLAERRAPAPRPASPARPACTSRRTSRPRPPAVPGTHQMALRPSTAPLRVPLPSPPTSSLPAFPDPESDSLRAASPTVARFLATVVTDPSLASTAASALVAELVDFAASCQPSGPYPELVGCLMYLMTCTRPDLAYPLSILARYVAHGRHRPEHMAAAKRVLRYLCSTSGMGLVLGGRRPVVLTGAMAAQELRWLTYLLTDLGEQPRSPPVLYVDNKAMLALCREHRLEHRMKHISLRYFLAHELQQRVQLRLAYVASEANTADIFTKALAPGDHQRFCTLLGLVPTWPHLLTS